MRWWRRVVYCWRDLHQLRPVSIARAATARWPVTHSVLSRCKNCPYEEITYLRENVSG